MSFSNKRGRPKRAIEPGNDTGTPELIMKRLHHMTDEVIDLCLARGLVTQSQHWCAIHLRWLYTLKFGAPCAKAIDLTDPGGIDIKQENEKWRAEREREYEEAIEVMGKVADIRPVLDVCVYNYRPSFLKPLELSAVNNASSGCVSPIKGQRELAHLNAGLDALRHLWKVR